MSTELVMSAQVVAEREFPIEWDLVWAWEREWLRSHDSEATRSEYHREFLRFARFCKMIDVHPAVAEEDDAMTFREYLSTLTATRGSRIGQPLSPSSFNRALASISSFYTFCARRKYVAANPFTYVDGRPDARVLPRPEMRPAHVEALFAAAAGMATVHDQAVVQAVLGFGFDSGLRISEIARATLAGLFADESGRIGLTLVGKGNKVRMVPVSTRTMRAVQGLSVPLKKRGGLILCNQDGKPYTRHVLDTRLAQVEKIAREDGARLPKRVHAHGLRRGSALNYMNRPVGVGETAPRLDRLKDFFGHSSISTTVSYLDEEGYDDNPIVLDGTVATTEEFAL